MSTAEAASVRDAFTQQVSPLVQLHADLAVQWPPLGDPAAAAARVRGGRVAYDPAEVIGAAGSLVVPYALATVALERSGLATDEEAGEARERGLQLAGTVRAWLAAEPMPRDRVRAVARRAAGVVASSILRMASAVVCASGAQLAWRRAHCPCCGGAPDFALPDRGGRTLVCSRCDAAWRAPVMGCLGCGASDAPTIARVRSPELRYTLTICNNCGRYIKEPDAGGALDPLVERVLTAQLDAAAEARGLRL